jgi:hypothetical protein
MSDDTPTQRFDAQTPADTNEPRSRLPLILGIIGGALLIAVIVLVVLLLGRGTPSTTASNTDLPTSTDSSGTISTPVPVPTVTVTVTATPAPNSGGGNAAPQKPNGDNVLITQYTISPMHPDCSSGHADLNITWRSVNGGGAFFGVNTVDAMEGGMGWNLPASGTQNDFPAGYHPFEYTCGNASEPYTLTVIGNGSKQSLTITVHRK